MRDGNGYIFGEAAVDIAVVSLPMRDGNLFLFLARGFSSGLLAYL